MTETSTALRDFNAFERTAGQSGVVISFCDVTARGSVLFAIADAKRNGAGDGIAYLKRSITTMTVYSAQLIRAAVLASSLMFRQV